MSFPHVGQQRAAEAHRQPNGVLLVCRYPGLCPSAEMTAASEPLDERRRRCRRDDAQPEGDALLPHLEVYLAGEPDYSPEEEAADQAAQDRLCMKLYNAMARLSNDITVMRSQRGVCPARGS